jgi:hypothetical protein
MLRWPSEGIHELLFPNLQEVLGKGDPREHEIATNCRSRRSFGAHAAEIGEIALVDHQAGEPFGDTFAAPFSMVTDLIFSYPVIPFTFSVAFSIDANDESSSTKQVQKRPPNPYHDVNATDEAAAILSVPRRLLYVVDHERFNRSFRRF